MKIQAKKTVNLIFMTCEEVPENDLEKLKDIAENLFPLLCNLWDCNDITFRFMNEKTVIDTFRLWG